MPNIFIEGLPSQEKLENYHVVVVYIVCKAYLSQELCAFWPQEPGPKFSSGVVEFPHKKSLLGGVALLKASVTLGLGSAGVNISEWLRTCGIVSPTMFEAQQLQANYFWISKLLEMEQQKMAYDRWIIEEVQALLCFYTEDEVHQELRTYLQWSLCKELCQAKLT